ncbi:MAG: hypothetical protein HC850_03960, partial [Rhodomicrobium sp.]|nr:hypothetical protein [Rhodomicrobium sp.]
HHQRCRSCPIPMPDTEGRWATSRFMDPDDARHDMHVTIVTFEPGSIPGFDATVTAGFEFDVPARFDTDRLEINLDGFRHGSIPNIPILEIRL